MNKRAHLFDAKLRGVRRQWPVSERQPPRAASRRRCPVQFHADALHVAVHDDSFMSFGARTPAAYDFPPPPGRPRHRETLAPPPPFPPPLPPSKKKTIYILAQPYLSATYLSTPLIGHLFVNPNPWSKEQVAPHKLVRLYDSGQYLETRV